MFQTGSLDTAARAHFHAEVTAVRALAGPGVLRVYDDGMLPDGRPYLVSELCDGSLADLVRQRGPLPAAQLAAIGAALAAALARVHGAGRLHLDITPRNILLRVGGEPVLADFGLSLHQEYGPGTLGGATKDFCAPELLANQPATPAADSYALGSTLYAALTGQPPRPARRGECELEYLARVWDEPVPPLPAGVPEPLRALLAALLGGPEQRPGAATVAARLTELAGTDPVAGSPGWVARPSQWSAPPATGWRAGPAPGGAGGHAAGGAAPYGHRPAPVAVLLDGEPTRPRVRLPERPAAEPAPAPARYRRRRALAVGTAAVAVLLTAGAVALTGRQGARPPRQATPTPGNGGATASAGADPAAGVIRLAAPQDDGRSVRLSWTGPPGLTYAVIVAEPGKPARPVLAGQATSLRLPVEPALRYCFLVQGTNAQHTYQSDPAPIRGATCTFR